MRPIILTVLSILAASLANAQSCADLKAGDFYYYPKNTKDRYLVHVSGDIERLESLDNKNDTALYKVEWKDSCSFVLKFIEGSGLTADERKFITHHNLAYKVEQVTGDYFTASIYVDKITGSLIGKDTVWMHPRTGPAASVYFSLTSPEAIKIGHFSDTSHMALLYVYRPGHLKLSLSSFFLYGDDVAMASMRNKSAYVFALYKEGDLTLSTPHKDSYAALPLHITFGKVYFVRAEMLWGFYKWGNYKMALTAVDETEGRKSFDEIYKQ